VSVLLEDCATAALEASTLIQKIESSLDFKQASSEIELRSLIPIQERELPSIAIHSGFDAKRAVEPSGPALRYCTGHDMGRPNSRAARSGQ